MTCTCPFCNPRALGPLLNDNANIPYACTDCSDGDVVSAKLPEKRSLVNWPRSVPYSTSGSLQAGKQRQLANKKILNKSFGYSSTRTTKNGVLNIELG